MKKITTTLVLVFAISLGYAQDSTELKEVKTRKDIKEMKEVKVNKERRNYGTYHSIDFDLGLNNYLENGKSPEESNAAYLVKPFGSWYFSINSINTTHVAGPLYLQWGGNLSWYNFKFEDENNRIYKQADEVVFEADPRGTDINPIKSKLTATYLNASVVPMLDFDGKNRHSRWFRNHRKHDGFRIGVGAYAGYKIASHSKFVYKDEGQKQRDKDKDSFYLNNWRYGARLQMGFRDVDLFVNYDISELFVEDRGPQLNAFSFGIII